MGNHTALRIFRSVQSSICSSCRSRIHTQAPAALRQFSTSPAPAKDFIDPGAPLASFSQGGLSSPSSAFGKGDYAGVVPDFDPNNPMNMENLVENEFAEEERHHFHVYATKHNTHITLTKPNRDALISVSCGNIGFRKAGRGTYDAAYQLAAFVMSRIQDKGLLTQIQKIELVFRGFGPGREAVTKAILGSEGRNVRGKICRLTDATRLKFGGVRSKKPRRLG
ncbi:translational machinery component [Delitschia confertaspora ATCC 74209]|uniref:Small ribosomal subunit protein uS11m n=1 Tax=Delitschia confertaspora ATCC 74209 TaxID=1513339 RepID=A0A9P4JPD2_9PLEO|nr:translational machinery component [Delitschia confertaspora ATCC 74209]